MEIIDVAEDALSELPVSLLEAATLSSEMSSSGYSYTKRPVKLIFTNSESISQVQVTSNGFIQEALSSKVDDNVELTESEPSTNEYLQAKFLDDFDIFGSDMAYKTYEPILTQYKCELCGDIVGSMKKLHRHMSAYHIAEYKQHRIGHLYSLISVPLREVENVNTFTKVEMTPALSKARQARAIKSARMSTGVRVARQEKMGNIRTDVCSTCACTFVNTQMLFDHQRTCHDYEQDDVSLYDLHMKTQYYCRSCLKLTDSSPRCCRRQCAVRDLPTLNEKIIFECTPCHFRSLAIGDAFSHIKEYHGNFDFHRVLFQCPQCATVALLDASALYRHIQIHHSQTTAITMRVISGAERQKELDAIYNYDWVVNNPGTIEILKSTEEEIPFNPTSTDSSANDAKKEGRLTASELFRRKTILTEIDRMGPRPRFTFVQLQKATGINSTSLQSSLKNMGYIWHDYLQSYIHETTYEEADENAAEEMANAYGPVRKVVRSETSGIVNLTDKDQIIQMFRNNVQKSQVRRKKEPLNNHLVAKPLTKWQKLINRPATIPCQYPGCSKMFVVMSKLRQHWKLTHAPKIIPCSFASEGCPEMFRQHRERLKHESYVHSTLKPYQCTFDGCNKRFVKVSTLTQHVVMFHSDIRDFKCSECEQRFAIELQLRKHMKRVHQLGDLPERRYYKRDGRAPKTDSVLIEEGASIAWANHDIASNSYIATGTDDEHFEIIVDEPDLIDVE